LRGAANDTGIPLWGAQDVLVKNLGIYYNYSNAEIEQVIETSARLLEGSRLVKVQRKREVQNE
jgi:hypothetical protein